MAGIPSGRKNKENEKSGGVASAQPPANRCGLHRDIELGKT